MSINCGGVWFHKVGQNMETDEENDEDCVEKGFQLAKVKFDRDGEGGREALGMWNRSINIWGWISSRISLIQEKQFIF